MNMVKRTIAMVIIVSMIMAILPAAALAETDETAQPVSDEEVSPQNLDMPYDLPWLEKGDKYENVFETMEFEKTATGFAYQTQSDGTVVITQYIGSGGDVNIPETIDGKRVSGIGKKAFFDRDSITSISIPASIDRLGDYAFAHCNSLTAINVSPDNPFLASYDGALYDKAMKILISCPAGKRDSFSVPSGVLALWDSAFWGCIYLTNVNLPSGLEAIDAWVFDECRNLQSIVIPNSVDFVGTEAFPDCNSLRSALFLGNVPSIFGDRVFYRVADGFVIRYLSTSVGWTMPTWRDYNSVAVHTVAFDSMGGSAVGGILADHGSAIAEPAAPSMAGYRIAGWFKEPACVNPWIFGADTVTANTTLYAKWFPSVVVQAKKIPSKVNAGTVFTIAPPAAPRGYTMQSVSYSSNKPSIATVDANGNVTFVGGGKATIIIRVVSQTVDKRGRVKTKTTTIKKNITVNQPIESIALNIADTTIARTQKVKLTTAFAPATASNKKVKWTTSNKKVATVSSAGVVTGKAGGTAVITCTARDGSGASASCTVTVTPINPTGIKLSKTVLNVKTGKTSSLKATVLPKKTDFKTVTWTSSNPAIVSVDARGRIRGISPGTVTITATTSNGLSASCTVTVQ